MDDADGGQEKGRGEERVVKAGMGSRARSTVCYGGRDGAAEGRAVEAREIRGDDGGRE